MAPVKYHYFHRFFTNSVMRNLVASAASLLALSLCFGIGDPF